MKNAHIAQIYPLSLELSNQKLRYMLFQFKAMDNFHGIFISTVSDSAVDREASYGQSVCGHPLRAITLQVRTRCDPHCVNHIKSVNGVK